MLEVFSIVATLGVIVFVASLFVTVVPPESVTHGAMHVIKRRVIRYAAAHGSAPPNLDVLVPIEGYTDPTADGWGNPILYEVRASRVVLRSLGPDEQPGHDDMVGEFSIWTTNGDVADESAPWIRDPFDR